MKFISKEPIEKGRSGDKKYHTVSEDGNEYLLRVSPTEQYERKKNEFRQMKKVAKRAERVFLNYFTKKACISEIFVV